MFESTGDRLTLARQLLAQTEARVGVERPALGRSLPLRGQWGQQELPLRRGQVVSVQGSHHLVWELLAAMNPRAQKSADLFTAGFSPQNFAIAVLGLPFLNPGVALEKGVDLADVIFIPDLQDAQQALSLCVSEFAVVVVGNVPLPERTRRQIHARVRERKHILLTTSLWPRADLQLTVSATRWHGLGAGSGYLATQELQLRVSGKGVRPSLRWISLGVGNYE